MKSNENPHDYLTLPEAQEEGRRVPEYTAQVVERLRKASNWCGKISAKRRKMRVIGTTDGLTPAISLLATRYEFIIRGDLLDERRNGKITTKRRGKCYKN